MSENLYFYKGLEEALPKNNIKTGALYHCTDTKNTYIGKSGNKLELWSSGTSYQQLDGGVVIGDGDAAALFSIAGGTSDREVINDIAGRDISSLTDAVIQEALGSRGVRLKNRLEDDTKIIPTADGESGIAYGTGSHAITSMSMAIGGGVEAGSKGFYVHKITIPDSGDITVQLSTEQAPYYEYKLAGITTIKANKNPVWSNVGEEKTQLSLWSIGDSVNIILRKIFCLCGSVTGINAEAGTITISNTGILTQNDLKEVTQFDSLLESQAVMLSLSPYQFSINVPAKPEVGITNLHFGAFATGLGSIAAATLSEAHGKMNLAVGQYGFATGDNNIVGYGGFVSGEDNTVLGYDAHGEGYGNIVSGGYSHAEGSTNVASGEVSHVEGHRTIASGTGSHAEGLGNEGNENISSGNGSHAEGRVTKATNSGAHSEGQFTEATGVGAHAEGKGDSADNRTKATGDGSHAEGSLTKATSIGAHAEGLGNIGSYNEASAAGAHAEGRATKAQGSGAHSEGVITEAISSASHSEGKWTKADGEAAHAEGAGNEGKYTTATGYGAHAEGRATIALGSGSHSEGVLTVAHGIGAHAEGKENHAKGDNSHAEGESVIALGAGSHAEGRGYTISGTLTKVTDSNEILTDLQSNEYLLTNADGYVPLGSQFTIDQKTYWVTRGQSTNNGGYTTVILNNNLGPNDGFYTGKFYNCGAFGIGSHSEGSNTKAEGVNSHAEGFNTHTIGDCSHTEGSSTETIGSSAHAEGYQTHANGDCSHAEGSSTEAIGSSAHAEGYWTHANGVCSHTEGSSTEAIGSSAHAEGFYAHANGDCSHAEGNYTTADGTYSHTEGSGTWAEGMASHAEGLGSHTQGEGSHAEGCGSVAYGTYSHAEGNVTQANGYASHAEGHGSIANGYSSSAINRVTEARGHGSFSAGQGTMATGANAFVIGTYNIIDKGGDLASGEKDESGNPIPQRTYEQRLKGQYAFILGKGDDDAHRSNATTIDWSGNIWSAGTLTANALIVKKNISYGNTFPSNPVEGQIFFKKI